MIALNFQPIDGTEEIAIQDLIQNKDALVQGNSATDSDQIQVWDGSSFTTYFYRNYTTKIPKFTDGPGWVKQGTTTKKTDATIKRGQGVWFARPATASAGTITMSGQVPALPKTHAIGVGFNMISSAFPTDMKLNDGPIDWEACGTVKGNSATDSDQIQVWDGNAFTTYFYRNYTTKIPKFTDGPGWVKQGTTTKKADVTITAGQGFWYARPESAAAGTLIELSPLAK